jgi:hypothetical protein
MHYIMKAYRVVGAALQILHFGIWRRWVITFTHGKAFIAHWTEDWVDSRASIDVLAKRESLSLSLCLCQESNTSAGHDTFVV